MKATKAIKKMVALGVGLTMVGATIFGASAAMLSDYPGPFVVGGVPASNLAIIVGDAADGSDVVGAVDIIQGLQVSAVVKVATGGGTGVTVEGDAVEIGSTSDLLEINEHIGDVRETLTEVDLLMLKGGQIVTDEGSTEYNQYLRFATQAQASKGKSSAAAVFAEDERDRVGHYLYWDSGALLFQWELEFEEGLESEIEGNDLVDLEDEDLFILGQPFVIVDTDLTDGNRSLTIELMGGAVSAILGENDKETYVVDGKEYEVEVLVISETSNDGEGSVKFRINGEITDELTDGETDVLADGTQIGIRDILATGKDIQKSIVQFYIGAYKVEFWDSNVTDTYWKPAGTEVNEETIEDSDVLIRGAMTGQLEFEIQYIRYNLSADAVLGDIYIAPGTGLREQLDEPEGMLTPFWDIKYEGLMDTGVTIVRLDAAGDDEYNIEFTNQEGIFYDFPYISNEGGVFKWGDDDDDLWFTESDTGTEHISDDDFFVLSNCRTNAQTSFIRPTADSTDDNTCFSHVLRYDNIDTSNRQLTFTDLGVGTREVSYDSTTNTANLIVAGVTYAITRNAAGPVVDNNLSIDLNGDGVYSCGNESYIGIQGEGILDLGYQDRDWTGVAASCNISAEITANTNYSTIQLITYANEMDEAANDEILNITVESRTNNEVGIIASRIGADEGTFFGIGTTGFGLYDLEENEDLEQGLSEYGVFMELFNPSSSDQAEDLTIEYPLSQRGARVFVTGGVVKTSSIATGGAEKIQPIQIGAAKLASEVADVTQFNAVVIGGPCANPIAAQLMGNPEPCWEAVPENKAILKLFEHTNGNAALLVAGRTALNTRQASRVLASGGLTGVDATEAEVSGTSLTDVTVKAA